MHILDNITAHKSVASIMQQRFACGNDLFMGQLAVKVQAYLYFFL